MWDRAVSVGLADCPPGSLRWAALGYRAGHRDGQEDLLRDLGNAGRAAAGLAGTTLAQPNWDTILRRREPDFTPCTVQCRACSRCIASEAYWARGGRDYLGVEGERRLAAEAVA